MKKSGRRTLLKFIGKFMAIYYAGLTQKKAFALTETKKTKKRKKRISVEEHIVSSELTEKIVGLYPQAPSCQVDLPMTIIQDNRGPKREDVLGDVANIEMRLKDMDVNSIDMQVLSWGQTIEELDPKEGIALAKKINNTLSDVIHQYPNRFAAFSTIPWQDAPAAIKELERAVKDLGLKGIKVNGTVKGEYLDSKKFWPILKKAEELNSPIFIHVEELHPSLLKAYSESGHSPATAGFNRDLDVSVQASRLICSGIFDECPNLNFILGHMGAGLPFWTPWLDRGGSEYIKKKPSYYVKNNFYAATIGHLFHPALICCQQALGADRILFAVDFPSEDNKEAIEFIETAQYLNEKDKEHIYHLNAERLFSIH